MVDAENGIRRRARHHWPSCVAGLNLKLLNLKLKDLIVLNRYLRPSWHNCLAYDLPYVVTISTSRAVFLCPSWDARRVIVLVTLAPNKFPNAARAEV